MSAVPSSVGRACRREQDQNVPPRPNPTTLPKSLKGSARDHPLGCISICATSSSPNIWRNRTPLGHSNFLFSDDRTLFSTAQCGTSRIADRWAAHQASETATIERLAHEAELRELSNMHPVSRISVSFLRESSPTKSNASAEITDIKASSLFQKWRELEAETGLALRRVDQNTTHSGSLMSERSGGSEASNSTELKSTDLESEVTMNSNEPLSSSSSTMSDECESEPRRVADAVKRFMISNSTQNCYTSYGTDGKELGPGPIPYHLNFSFAGNNSMYQGKKKHQATGIQAVENLCLQPECERRIKLDELEDRNAVSQFKQKNQTQEEAQQKESHVPLPRVEEEANLCHDVKRKDKNFFSDNCIGQEQVDTSVNLLGWEGNVVSDMDSHLVPHMKPAEEVILLNYSLQEREESARRHIMDDDCFEHHLEMLFFNPSLQEQEQSTGRHTMDDDWLERHSDNVELLKLLERRTVSRTLASNFQQRMDRIILSFVEKQRQETTEDKTAQDHMTEEDEEYYINDHEVNSGDSVASTSIQLPLPLGCRQYQRSSQEESLPLEQPHSNGMQFVYELREDIVRLHQKMCELKKSIQSCMELQIKLQHFAKTEAFEVMKCPGSLETFYDRHKLTRRGNCCICYEMPVDSLLYRCGHMCTCFKCAHELQWDSGSCPICQAPILDVVHVYSEP